MSLVKVWSQDRSVKKSVIAETMEELLEKGIYSVKLGLDSNSKYITLDFR